MTKKFFTNTGLILGLAFVFGFLPLLFSGKLTVETKTITVQEKSVKREGDVDRYLIFTENSGVMECTDSWLDWKFDSSDFYGKLRVGETYSVTTRGWRVPFLSWYPNIVEINN